MTLNIDTIRKYPETGNIALNQQGAAVEKPALHGMKSLFGPGDSRVKNAETLTAIRHAILNDPRFAAPDVQAEAKRLLSQVRADRAMDMEQIKGVIRAVDDLTPGTEAVVKARETAHLAAKMPTWATRYEKTVADVLAGRFQRGMVA